MDNIVVDLSAVMPQGKKFSVDKKEYELIYNYKSIRRLEEIYGSMSEALEAFNQKNNDYEIVLNFLYSALCDAYKITKQEIETWIGTGSTIVFKSVIYEALLKSYGEQNETDTEGEA